MDRDGGVVTEAEVLLEVEWTRTLDEVSTAYVVIQPGGDCCERLDQVRSWRHKLIIWRDGAPVWEGPIVRAVWQRGAVRVDAVDILGWLDRRVPHQSITFSDSDLADIAAWLIQDGFAPDDPGHTVDIIAPSRIRGDREYEADVGQTGDHLRDLAATGIDYTAVGSRILILPEDHTGRIGALSDDDFPDGLTVAEDGVALGTRWIVHGRDDVKGEAGGRHPYYGLLERVAEETSVLDDASAAAAARSKLRTTSPAPVFIDSSQETTLSPQAPVDVARLVPGWCLDVTTTSTCRTIAQSLKIVGVRVRESAGTDSSVERVSVQLAPAGAEA